MNFIIYENEDKFVDCCLSAIYKIMGNSKINYKITKLNKFDCNIDKSISKLDGNKIYIIDCEINNNSGIELSKRIRKSGDWISPIIVLSNREELKDIGYTKKLLMLDCILKSDINLKEKLEDTLEVALEITFSMPSIAFTYKGDYYHINYNDIFYIEKSLNNNSSMIITLNNEYQINKTINELEKELKSEKIFFKSHRSCIINLEKIIKVDYVNGIVYFTDRKINLLSRNNKKGLKKRLNELNRNVEIL